MATERERFEAAAFAYYTGLKAAGWSHPDEGDSTPESLFWLQPNGQYGVINLNAAWWAWQARAGWTESAVQLPPLEIPVLCMWGTDIRILERRTEHPGFEDGHASYTYWDDPMNDGQNIDDDVVTHWQRLPNNPT